MNAGTVTKRSRAARRGEINIDNAQVKSLEQLPRLENTNVANSIIRTTAKNEDLLAQKLLKKKKASAGVSKNTKEKKTRFEKIDGRLSTKLERSMERTRMVKSQRKLGWDLINSRLKDDVSKLEKEEEEAAREADEKAAADAEVAAFFEDESAPSKTASAPQNPFELLGEEVEA